jgi:hypothetical protein
LLATKGKLGFPPQYHVLLYHLRMLYYSIYSVYPEMEDFLVRQWDAQNHAKNEMKKERKAKKQSMAVEH